MAAEILKNLKNHQTLEMCAMEIFKKIQKKKIVEDAKWENGDYKNTKK